MSGDKKKYRARKPSEEDEQLLDLHALATHFRIKSYEGLMHLLQTMTSDAERCDGCDYKRISRERVTGCDREWDSKCDSRWIWDWDAVPWQVAEDPWAYAETLLANRDYFKDYFREVQANIKWVDAVPVSEETWCVTARIESMFINEGPCEASVYCDRGYVSRISTRTRKKWDEAAKDAFRAIVVQMHGLEDSGDFETLVKTYNGMPWEKRDKDDVQDVNEAFEALASAVKRDRDKYEEASRCAESVKWLWERMAELREQYMNDAAIARATGITAKYVKAWRAVNGLCPVDVLKREHELCELEQSFDIEAARRAFLDGKTVKEIAKAAGTDEKTITKWKTRRKLSGPRGANLEKLAREWGMDGAQKGEQP